MSLRVAYALAYRREASIRLGCRRYHAICTPPPGRDSHYGTGAGNKTGSSYRGALRSLAVENTRLYSIRAVADHEQDWTGHHAAAASARYGVNALGFASGVILTGRRVRVDAKYFKEVQTARRSGYLFQISSAINFPDGRLEALPTRLCCLSLGTELM